MAAPLVVPALTRHTATVIMAHGLGDSGAGWYVPYLARPSLASSSFSPITTIRAVTRNATTDNFGHSTDVPNFIALDM
ncbi:hypothetical protein RJZ57_006955 [Blastomyces gilchristii]